MTPWNQFFPDVMVHVSGCPNPVAQQALLRAARDFCTQTRAWVETLDQILIVQGTAEYDLPLDSGAELVRLEDWADVSGTRVKLTSQNRALFHCESAVYTVTGRSVVVSPEPQGAGTLTLRAALMPSNSAAGVPDDIFGQYVELIALGAVSRLQKQPGKPYTDPGAAMSNQDEYQRQVESLKIRLWRGRTTDRPRTLPSPF